MACRRVRGLACGRRRGWPGARRGVVGGRGRCVAGGAGQHVRADCGGSSRDLRPGGAGQGREEMKIGWGGRRGGAAMAGGGLPAGGGGWWLGWERGKERTLAGYHVGQLIFHTKANPNQGGHIVAYMGLVGQDTWA